MANPVNNSEGFLVPHSNAALDVDVVFDIPWTDIVLKDIIGRGSSSTIYRADWNGDDVAVKSLSSEQDLHPERFDVFWREVSIMRRLQHSNIVLFKGVVNQPPNLSIVTEYLPRGSLFTVLHKRGPHERLDERLTLRMAFDVAKGMNYLHRRNPPIVHRDLKSPNLLVDNNYTVKVADFGLSRLKTNTFLSSKLVAGTVPWMAPELLIKLRSDKKSDVCILNDKRLAEKSDVCILNDKRLAEKSDVCILNDKRLAEKSDVCILNDKRLAEKSDVYSFGVILWELVTLQMPWSHLNAPQIIAAVGHMHKRLEIPGDVNPQVAALIEACWAEEPSKRPSFTAIMVSLRILIKERISQMNA